nr:PREDICTED: nuclear pore complex protein Nup160 homolog [Bemisia tabaci]
MMHYSFKEIVSGYSQLDKWREISLNTGGTPSTLQDIKVQQRSGGYCYKQCPNRFIYWRTNDDVLELVEQSLNLNLSGNQVRYRFQDSPILEGVTIHETFNRVVILVPTISSVHRLTFSHPPPEEELSDIQSLSIFADATANSARDSTTFHVINTAPNLPHAATSCLTANKDALFALALSSGTIMLVRLDPLSGIGTCSELRQDSAVPRFLSNFMGKTVDDYVSLIVHPSASDVFLFALTGDGQVRVWSCDRGVSLKIPDNITKSTTPLVQGAYSHIMRKAVNTNNLILGIYLCLNTKSRLFIVEPIVEHGFVQLPISCNFLIPENLDLMDLTFDSNTVWCLCRTSEGETVVHSINLLTGQWQKTDLETNPKPLNSFLSTANLDPRLVYLQYIFDHSHFSVNDISKALGMLCKPEDRDNSLSLKQQVEVAIENEIQMDVSDYELTDEDYIDIAEKCWNKFYSCCVQYHQTSSVPLGIIWLHSMSCVVLIKKNGFSILRNKEYLESIIANKQFYATCFERLVNALASLELDYELNVKFDQALHGLLPLDSTIALIAGQISRDDKFLSEAEWLSNNDQLSVSLVKLVSLLKEPETFEPVPCIQNTLRSSLGVTTVAACLNQVVSLRLLLSRNVLVFLQLMGSPELATSLLEDLIPICQSYWLLQWCGRQSITAEYLASTSGIAQPSLMDTVSSLAHHLWPAKKSANIAEFLLGLNKPVLVQELARLTDSKSWRIILAQAYLQMGDAFKAYDKITAEANTSATFLRMIQLFEKHNYSDIVIELADTAISQAELDDPELPTLHSLLFLHHLKLCHYTAAFTSLRSNPDPERLSDCLRQLVVALIQNARLDILLSLPFGSLLPQLESIMISRARSLPTEQAALYYSFLYSLHIKFDNLKKAATVMFEQGLRAEDPEMQRQCYAICLNCLYLVNPNNAWILKPKEDEVEEIIEVLELKDIRQEYELATAKIKLSMANAGTYPQELVSMLIHNGFYKNALRICHLCNLSYSPVLVSLAAACVALPHQVDPWSWLVRNEISELVAGDSNACTVAWRLLECLLQKYEKDNQTVLHKAVADKLMSCNVFLPHWLETSYKKRNASELLRLYLNYGDLKQASTLACDLLLAALGCGTEHFSLAGPLVVASPSLCLPIETIDLLLLELSHHNKDEAKDLESVLETYITTAMKATADTKALYGC